MLQAVPQLEVLWLLGELSEEFLTASVSQLLLVAGLHDHSGLSLEQTRGRLGLLLLFLVHLEVLSSDLLHDKSECVFILMDGLSRGWELGGLGVLASQTLAISLDYVVVR